MQLRFFPPNLKLKKSSIFYQMAELHWMGLPLKFNASLSTLGVPDMMSLNFTFALKKKKNIAPFLLNFMFHISIKKKNQNISN